MFGIGNKLKVFEKDGKFGVGTKRELVPQYSFDSKPEAEQYILDHGKDIFEEG